MGKVALITGTGMDSSYLSDLLVARDDYELIVCVTRPSAYNNTERVQHLLTNPKFTLLRGDTTDKSRMTSIINDYWPNELYHLAAQSHVGFSFESPEYTFNSIVKSTSGILEILADFLPHCKFYHASSSEQFGDTTGYTKQDENTPFRPLSPYAIAKTCAHNITHYFRRTKEIKTYTGILFNHEGARRGDKFVTRKITQYIGNLLHNDCNIDKVGKLQLGDVSTKRDWGYAPDYVRAMHLLVQQDEIHNMVIATGETHTIEEFLDRAFTFVGLNYETYCSFNNRDFMRPNEVKYLCGDATLAKEKLGWEPSVTFNELVEIMVSADVEKEATKTS